MKVNGKDVVKTLLLLFFIVSLSACGLNGAERLPLEDEPYLHPSGIFTIRYPEGWRVEPGETEAVIWLEPPAGGADVTIFMIAEVLAGVSEDEMGEFAQGLLEAAMIAYLPYDDYEIVNSADVRVARNPSLILDIARPEGDSYHVGRMVLVYLPGHLVFLTGYGPRADWDAFLPTFRQMVDEMAFSVRPFGLGE